MEETTLNTEETEEKTSEETTEEEVDDSTFSEKSKAKTEETDKENVLSAEAKKEEETETKEVPDKYDLKLPEDNPLGDEGAVQLEEFAKELGLSNEQAQKLLDNQVQAVKGYEKHLVDSASVRSAEWKKEIENDPEIGRDNHGEFKQRAKQVLAQYADEEFIAALNETEMGNFPPLARFIHRISKATSNDSLVLGSSGRVKKPKSAAEVFYGPNSEE